MNYAREGMGFKESIDVLDATESLSEQEKATILDAQNALFKLLFSGGEDQQICDEICLLAEQLLPNAVASIMLLDSEATALTVYAAPSVPDDAIDMLNGLVPGPHAGSCGTAVFEDTPIFVDNTLTDPRWEKTRDFARTFDIMACWSFPIRAKGGKAIGSFALSSFERREPSIFNQLVLQVCALTCSFIFEQQKTHNNLLLYKKMFEKSSDGIFITDSKTRIIALNPASTTIYGYQPESVLGKTPRVFSSGHHDETFYQEMWKGLAEDDFWAGEITNRNMLGKDVSGWLRINVIRDQNHAITNYVGIFTDITEQKLADQRITEYAFYDSLTNLPNRRMFLARLEEEIHRAERHQKKLALLYIDLDNFKEVNDTLGHNVGDQLLVDISELLQAKLRATDVIARLGGDEFTILLTEVERLEDIDTVCQGLIGALNTCFYSKGNEIYSSASMGVSVYPDDTKDKDALIIYADQAMYAAKKEGRDQYQLFTPEMQAQLNKRMQISNELRSAIKEQQFKLYYQPIIDLRSGQIEKVEALMRWEHPTMGLISPAKFIPVAEENKLIIEIGQWVFRTAVEQLQSWQARFNQYLQMSVNTSPVQFLSTKHMTATWIECLKQHALTGKSMVIEITENLILEANDLVNSKLLELRDSGIQVALDDFGTGYSSLAYLQNFDIDYIKIDKRFINDLSVDSKNHSLCQAIISMAHALDMKVVAEGVETEEQHHIIKQIGCDFGQGFYYGPPLTTQALEQALESQS